MAITVLQAGEGSLMKRKITLKTPNSKRPLFTDERILFQLSPKDLEKSQARKDLEKRIKDCPHMSKPDAPNATVWRDSKGRWIFEVYTPIKKDGEDGQ